MQLTKEQIQEINERLIKFGVKYVDVRLELIDHLASDFETKDGSISLKKYLSSKQKFIEDFIKIRHTTIHWVYQRRIWRQFFKFFYQPKLIIISLIVGFAIYNSLQTFEDRTNALLYIIPISVMQFAAFFTHYRQNKVLKKIQSAQMVFNIMSLPFLFISFFPPLKEFLLSHTFVFLPYWGVTVLLSVSAFIVVYKSNNEIIKTYKTIIK